MIVKTFIKQYINEDDIQHIIFHNGGIVIRETIKTIFFLGIFYGIYILLSKYIQGPLATRIFGLIGVIFFLKYCSDFFNKYIDCLILSKEGMTFFRWDGLRKYKTDFFDWNKIESISHEQHTFWDKIFLKGNISIQLEHGVIYTFDQISQPKQQVKKILALKENHSSKEGKESKSSDENITMLSEVLGEVVKEYLDRKKEQE